MAAQLPSVYNLPQHPQPRAITGAAQTAPESLSLATEVRSLLCELRDLLDSYGPAWYDESHHDRITAALALLRRAEGGSVS
jgi:hypothetical protein